MQHSPQAGHHPTPTLTRDSIVDAAIQIVEQEGPDALTLRRLGAQLGTNHTAVLRHFSNKDHIVRALAERLMVEALSDFAPGNDWRQTLISLAHQVRSACLRHPAVAVLAAVRVSRSPAEFQGADTVIAALSEAGLRDRDAALVYRAITDLALAAGAFSASVLTLDEDARQGDRDAMGREYLLASPRAYPHLAAVAPFLADIDDDEQFAMAIDLIVAGVAAKAAALASN
jgi:AcrR family transcriptional regulator